MIEYRACHAGARRLHVSPSTAASPALNLTFSPQLANIINRTTSQTPRLRSIDRYRKSDPNATSNCFPSFVVETTSTASPISTSRSSRQLSLGKGKVAILRMHEASGRYYRMLHPCPGFLPSLARLTPGLWEVKGDPSLSGKPWRAFHDAYLNSPPCILGIKLCRTEQGTGAARQFHPN